VTTAPNLEHFPDELKALRRWVTWRHVTRSGKTTKPPLQSITEPGAWLSVSEACDRVVKGAAEGPGFVLGDGIVGIDLDGCIDIDGAMHEIACDLIGLDTYAEMSPSGSGLHAFIRATISRPRRMNARDGVPRREIYDGRERSARFFTVTGARLGDVSGIREGPLAQAALDAFIAKWFPEEPRPVQNDNEADDGENALDDDLLIRVMFSAKGGAAWRATFAGDRSRYSSQSEADFALCRKLRFYTHADAGQMDRLFRRSGLMRAKWDKKRGAQTYGESTIAKAIAKGGPFYTPRDSATGAKARESWERKAWAKLPAWAFIRLGGVGELACRVYGIIASYANAKSGEAWPSIETIAAHLRVSERRVKGAIVPLKAADLITSTRRPGTSNLYSLALRVPETITPYATRRAATMVTESGQIGCPSHGTITNQEPTIYKHRRERGRPQQKKIAQSERKHAERTSCETARSLPEPRIPPTRGARATSYDDTSRSRYAGWDGAANTAAGRDLLWDCAKEKLGLVGRVVFGSNIFRRPDCPIQPRLGL
jgi:hypothetical protein